MNPDHFTAVRAGVHALAVWQRDHPGQRLDLDGADLSGLDLRGADLANADLRRAHLESTNLAGAILNGAKLEYANLVAYDPPSCDLSSSKLLRAQLYDARLWRAELAGADLSGAILHGAIVWDCNLTHARLVDADLRDAVFKRINFEKTDFIGARFGATVIMASDLSKARSLDQAQHHGRSVVDPATLIQSRGSISPIFLQGCGLSDWEIKGAELYRPDLSTHDVASLLDELYDLRASGPIPYYSVFISYGHVDKAIARRLYVALQTHGIRCWMDDHELRPGDDLYDRIDEGIKLWDKTLLLCSEHSLTSPWVDREIDKVLQKEAQLWRQRGQKVLALIPVDLDGYLFAGWQSGKASVVRSRLAADFTGIDTDPGKFDSGVEGIVDGLRAGDTWRRPPPTPRL
jgi:hypothetical protein